MDSDFIPQFRDDLLLQLHDGRTGLQPTTMRLGAQARGFNVGLDDVVTQLTVLEKKGMVDSSANRAAAIRRKFHLTESGTEYLDSEGLI